MKTFYEMTLILEQNRPQPSLGSIAMHAAKSIKPSTKIYRGLRLSRDMLKMNVRQILESGATFKQNTTKQSDPWTTDFPVAERFARGAAINAQGQSMGMANTVNVIVEAQLPGPSKDLIDWEYWGKTIAGKGVSKGSDIDSYWQPQMIGNVDISDNHIENEIPILHTAYKILNITGLYVKDPQTNQWIKKTEPNILG